MWRNLTTGFPVSSFKYVSAGVTNTLSSGLLVAELPALTPVREAEAEGMTEVRWTDSALCIWEGEENGAANALKCAGLPVLCPRLWSLSLSFHEQ